MREKILKRFIFVYGLLVLLAFGIFVKGAFVATLERGKWNEMSEKVNSTKPVTLFADRGNICAEDGRILALSVPYYDIRFDAVSPHDTVFMRNVDSLAYCLSKMFGDKSERGYRNYLVNARRKRNRYLPLGDRRINHLELKKLQSFPILRYKKYKGGLIIKKRDMRIQPHKDLASRTIGALNINDAGQMEGYVGLERAYEAYLKGENGAGHTENMSGRLIVVEDKEPKHGLDVFTTINVDYQDFTQNALRKQLQKYDAESGIAVVMEVETGDIKAIANLKREGPGVYSETMNYAINNSTEPGSVIKAASAIALLEDGYVSMKDTFDMGASGNYRFYDRVLRESSGKGVGRITLKGIIERSSNSIARLVFDKYKAEPEKYVNRLYSMGLNETLGIEISGEGKPLIKYPKDKGWSGITLPWMSVGYELQLTPMQILSFYNAIANNGQRMKPRFVKEIRDRGEVVETFDVEEVGGKICSNETLEAVNEMLVGVVEEGTAKNIRTPYYQIAGKTGTARMASNNKGYQWGNYRASFVGYFPANKPQYSCIVVVERPSMSRGYYASVVSATVFKEIADQIYTMEYIDSGEEIAENVKELPISMNGSREDLLTVYKELSIPVEDVSENSDYVITSAKEDQYIDIQTRKIIENLMPNVRGMGLKDALFLLENLGLKVRAKGYGMVSRQSISPGVRIKKGNVVYLELR